MSKSCAYNLGYFIGLTIFVICLGLIIGYMVVYWKWFLIGGIAILAALRLIKDGWDFPKVK